MMVGVLFSFLQPSDKIMIFGVENLKWSILKINEMYSILLNFKPMINHFFRKKIQNETQIIIFLSTSLIFEKMKNPMAWFGEISKFQTKPVHYIELEMGWTWLKITLCIRYKSLDLKLIHSFPCKLVSYIIDNIHLVACIND